MSGQEREALRPEDLLVWAVEDGVIRMSQVFDADLQDALVKFAGRFQTARAAQPAAVPVAWAVNWGLPPTRRHSVHIDRATADGVASEIKSNPTEVRPLVYGDTAPPPAAPAVPNAWQEAVRERFAGYCIDMPAGHDPAAALKALVEWEVRVALDPQVSAEAQALVDMGRQQAVPEGWRLVPEKITEEMHTAAVRTAFHCTGNDDFPPCVYAAMIAAAPQAPARPMIPHDPSRGQPTMEDVRRVIHEHRDVLKALHEGQPTGKDSLTDQDASEEAWLASGYAGQTGVRDVFNAGFEAGGVRAPADGRNIFGLHVVLDPTMGPDEFKLVAPADERRPLSEWEVRHHVGNLCVPGISEEDAMAYFRMAERAHGIKEQP